MVYGRLIYTEVLFKLDSFKYVSLHVNILYIKQLTYVSFSLLRVCF